MLEERLSPVRVHLAYIVGNLPVSEDKRSGHLQPKKFEMLGSSTVAVGPDLPFACPTTAYDNPLPTRQCVFIQINEDRAVPHFCQRSSARRLSIMGLRVFGISPVLAHRIQFSQNANLLAPALPDRPIVLVHRAVTQRVDSAEDVVRLPKDYWVGVLTNKIEAVIGWLGSRN